MGEKERERDDDLANDFRNSRAEETEARAAQEGGHVAWSATSLMKNVGCGVPRTLVVTEICKYGAVVRDGYWPIPRSGLNFETMLNFWFD